MQGACAMTCVRVGDAIVCVRGKALTDDDEEAAIAEYTRLLREKAESPAAASKYTMRKRKAKA